MVEVLVQNHQIGLQQAVVILDANGNIVSTFGGGAGGATAANQATQITAEEAILAKLDDPATQTTLAAVLAKIIAAPATEAKQDTLQTTAESILAKILAAPATEASQALINAILGVPTGAAIVTDADGTIQRYLRGLVAMAAAGTINVRVKNGASFDIPAFNYQAFTYVGATNNVATQVFKSGGAGGTTVATLTFAYVAAGAADDDLIASITQS